MPPYRKPRRKNLPAFDDDRECGADGGDVLIHSAWKS